MKSKEPQQLTISSSFNDHLIFWLNQLNLRITDGILFPFFKVIWCILEARGFSSAAHYIECYTSFVPEKWGIPIGKNREINSNYLNRVYRINWFLTPLHEFQLDFTCSSAYNWVEFYAQIPICVQRLDIVTESLSRENKVLLSPEVSKKVVQTQ